MPISIASTGINDVVGARKYSSVQIGATVPYTSIILLTKNKKAINVANEGEYTNLSHAGINLIVPGLIDHFLRTTQRTLVQEKFKTGDDLPVLCGLMNEYNKGRLIIGIQATGGPIHYIMDASPPSFDTDTGVMVIGDMITAKEYAKQKTLYLMLSPQSDNSTFDSDAIISGSPAIYSDGGGVVTVVDELPAGAKVINLF